MPILNLLNTESGLWNFRCGIGSWVLVLSFMVLMKALNLKVAAAILLSLIKPDVEQIRIDLSKMHLVNHPVLKRLAPITS